MGQNVSTLFRANFNAAGFGSSLTADQVTEGIDLSQQTAIVTGATSGLGKETARVLAKRGAHVILVGRKMDTAEQVKSVILRETPSAQVDLMPLDLSNMESVRNFVKEFEAKNISLNILVNNAGVFNREFLFSDMGIEQMFATHVVGVFMLTELLLKKMKQSAKESGIEGRVVITGSDAHRLTSIYSDGINFESLKKPGGYDPLKAYAQSKVGAILLAEEFASRLTEEKANVTANVAHPGTVSSELGRTFIDKAIPGPDAVTDIAYKGIKPTLKTPEMGAATICYIATRPEVKGVSGKYFANCTEIQPNKDASNPQLRHKLWEYCEAITSAGVGM
ncbi:hypothetical protein MPTK1_5g09770 [Marchantia polymorpha subsp. ruderalis]|nr:hypothetical protein MARPO_0048s0093 [Marchantia polymorpha]BBN11182.1 hypothetical protein Mp_5g09770 [Marchantia polymorpha subsp. ruderalis]|eukprot:PTQ38988.1 hypothetical protein MARPO_0048s0093 [Marchantia polymorpha]